MIPTIAFLQSMGGVGTTSLVYHLAWMYADLGHPILAVDLDPRATLTAAMIDPERLQVLWSEGNEGALHRAIGQRMSGADELVDPHCERIGDRLELLVGDPGLSTLEDALADHWARARNGEPQAFFASTAFHQCIQAAARRGGAEIVLIDLGPSLGALNRAALVASQHIVVPVTPDLFSLQGLKHLGPRVKQWQEEWRDRRSRNASAARTFTSNVMRPAGYAVLRHPVRLDRPTRAGELWMSQIPETYATCVLGEPTDAKHPSEDPHCLGLLKWYGSLMPMAQEARKPIFHLKPADGALGAHASAARAARDDWKHLAERIAQATWQLKQQP